MHQFVAYVALNAYGRTAARRAGIVRNAQKRLKNKRIVV